MRRLLPVVLSLLALPLVAGAAGNGGRVYTWKDAQGVTHFSDSPPPAGVKAAKQITVRGDTPVTADAAAPAAAAPTDAATAAADGGASAPLTDSPEARQQVCAQARRNAELLEGPQQVSMDLKGDGASQTLSAEQRQEQLAQARERIAFYCR
ncbi:DUF4124 domain-containing protein [Dokdonella koreensis]|uniref:DUF4124 domain-containing protein n=1 Tax=Dokdonella koreensis TaxID=323415 RepID=UPI0016818261|nr:DUF4124 domain-containing protein [Dokdonella koreensis]